jgi:hypothetical protein
MISSYQNMFDIILGLNNRECYYFDQNVSANTIVMNTIYSNPNIFSKKNNNCEEIVFVGGGNIFNQHAIKFLTSKILTYLPPNFNISVYGSICNCDELFVGENRLIRKGFINDLSKVFENALFSIVPILAGTGSKIKIFDSINYRTPVITFFNNSHDILEQGINCFYVDNEIEFAKKMIYLKNNPEECIISEDYQNKFNEKINNIKDEFYSLLI